MTPTLDTLDSPTLPSAASSQSSPLIRVCVLGSKVKYAVRRQSAVLEQCFTIITCWSCLIESSSIW